jgi:8-oxo-dGTP pyrophosphatase MutT (NUDIX family)
LVEHHKGQISFPGGAHDPEDEDLLQTALRETFEEIGVTPGDVELIGALDDILTISNFVVSPYVGVLRQRGPYTFNFSPFEVAEILEVPLDHLLDAANYVSEVQERDGMPITMHSFRYGEHVIWGATGRITRQFLDLLLAAVLVSEES